MKIMKDITYAHMIYERDVLKAEKNVVDIKLEQQEKKIAVLMAENAKLKTEIKKLKAANKPQDVIELDKPVEISEEKPKTTRSRKTKKENN